MSGAVNILKRTKALGPDELIAEYLKAGGDVIITWLMKILNAFVELEVISEALKCGVVVPIYKGGGKDSIKEITFTSMVSKILEFLLLGCLELVYMEVGLRHVNQSAYRKAVSCSDAIFATQEVVAKYP